MTEPTTVRVSVIIPVFEPGAGFDDLIASLDRQTLDAGRFEVLLCDDGSGPETRDRLARVAESRPNVRVLTLPHTGWPGAPRNAGIDAARGQYVFFSDQDDRLFEGALEHLCDYADRHSSDVVIGKVVGVGRRIPQMFRRDIPHAQLGKDPLLELLTPHKLFRTSFLREHGIRFPDGKVRLEDHLFVMQAYFAATTISILSSERCYAWLKNPGSASSSRIDPETYFPHLEAVLDIVEEHTTPGPLRDTLLRHWYRGKILKRLGGRRMVRYPDDYRARFLDVVIPLSRRRFGPGVQQGLAFPLRVRSALLLGDHRDELVRLAEFEAALTCSADLTAARWMRRGKLVLTVRVGALRVGDQPLVFEERPVAAEHGAADAGSGATRALVWRPPAHLGLDVLPEETFDATRDLRDDQVELFLRDRRGPARRVPGPVARRLDAATLTIDPLHTFSRRSTSRGGPLRVRVQHAGWSVTVPLRADQATVDAVGRSPLLAGRRCTLTGNDDGTLALKREWPRGQARDTVARAVRRAGRAVRRIRRRGSGAGGRMAA
ncbi:MULTISPECIES: glycosyltransferase family 2 protein [Microbacterium]|uniref:glycosyltransferase family 2 protein n=1 Tax=Microbacterium TaxID=33882 RepID=UPI00142FD533|nr:MULTISPECIES: glycosyltransferase [Microbacterium]MCK6065969.1 glycosyltransferase [Microbacterium sp. EYE_512]